VVQDYPHSGQLAWKEFDAGAKAAVLLTVANIGSSAALS